VIGDLGEAEPPVKPQRRIELLDEDSDAFGFGARAFVQCPQQRGAEAAAAPGGQQRDIDDVQTRLSPAELKPPGGRTVLLNHVKAAFLDRAAIMAALRLELSLQECLLLLRAPGRYRQLLFARRGEEPHQERDIGLGFGPQPIAFAVSAAGSVKSAGVSGACTAACLIERAGRR
jgi:hypothetical protein